MLMHCNPNLYFYAMFLYTSKTQTLTYIHKCVSLKERDKRKMKKAKVKMQRSKNFKQVMAEGSSHSFGVSSGSDLRQLFWSNMFSTSPCSDSLSCVLFTSEP